MTKTTKKFLVLIVAIIVATVFLLPLGANDVAYAETFGGKEYSSLWYYDSMNLQDAKAVIATWDLSKVTTPIIIACIDTGITASHELFNGVLTRNANGDLLGYNSYAAIHEGVSDTVNISDESSGHGTKVAGVMAMLIRELGLQNYIKIYPIKANTPTKDTFSIESVINALDWATGDSVKASVINMSLSAAGSGDTAVWKTSESLQYALTKASKTAVLVAAAGNNSTNSNLTDYYPAAHEGVLGVMGYGKDGEIYSTSNYGTAYDIVAPEREIYTSRSSGSTYDYFDGTSAAAPLVSVAAALLKLRYIIEGNLTIENGEQKPSGVNFETMLSNLTSRAVTKGTNSFCTLDFEKVVAQDFSNTDYHYQSPTAIAITGDGTLGTEEYYDAYVQRADEIQEISFIATIKPLGKTNPVLEEAVEWYVREIKIDEVEDEVLSEQRVGNGTKYGFVAPHGGDYEIEARLKYGEQEIKSARKVHVEYLPYLAGEVRVTLNGHETDGVDNAPSSKVIYADQPVIFGLTGIDYVDQSVEIKWFVNGEEVDFIGTTFKFEPKKAGTYVISAKYGNRAEITGSYTFTLTVKPVMTNPTYISLVVVGGVLVAGGIAAGVAIPVLKKKKASAKTQE